MPVDLQATPPPSHHVRPERSFIPWIAGAVVVVVAVAFGLWAMNGHPTISENSPAVIATPAPAAGVPAPAPETTTGQSEPRNP